MKPNKLPEIPRISRHHFSMVYRQFRFYLSQTKHEDQEREARFFVKMCKALGIDDLVMFIICLSVHGDL